MGGRFSPSPLFWSSSCFVFFFPVFVPPRSNYSGKKRLLFWLGVNIWPSLKQIRTGSYKNKHISAKSDFVYASCWNHLEFMERFVITTRPLVYRACLLYLFILLLCFYSTGIFLRFNRFPFWPIESNNTRWVSTGYGWQKAIRCIWSLEPPVASDRKRCRLHEGGCFYGNRSRWRH